MNYENGLTKLGEYVAEYCAESQDTQLRDEFDLQKFRLRSIVDDIKLYGPNEKLDSDLYRIVLQLNATIRKLNIEITFDDLCIQNPIIPNEIIELKQILQFVKVADEPAYESYNQLPDKYILPNECLPGDLFKFLLDDLAKRPYTPPDKAPLLEFLERCNPFISERVQTELGAWKNKVALRLGMDLKAICAKIKPTHSVNQTAPVLLIKIQSDASNEKAFIVKAWLYKNQEWESRKIEKEKYMINEFDIFIQKLLNQVATKLGKTAKHLTVEIILPLIWFDWNINALAFKQGETEVSLCSRFPLIIRSLERLDENNYAYPRSLLESKWDDELCASRLLIDTEVCCISSEHDYCKVTLENLEETKVLLALTPFDNGRDEMFKNLRTMLDAGIPFAFWTLQESEPVENLREQIYSLLKQFTPENWPQKIMQCRKSESFWHNINLFWDNPKQLPPEYYGFLTPPEIN